MRKLKEERAERLAHLVEIGAGNEPVALADRARVQAVEVLVATFLVHVEVALRMEADRRAAALVAPDP